MTKSVGSVKPDKVKELAAKTWCDDTIFPKRLEAALKRRGLTNTYLVRAGIYSGGTLYNYIHYNRTPTAYTLQKICSAIDCSADYLIGLTDEDKWHGKHKRSSH